jgi:hypothetical protein
MHDRCTVYLRYLYNRSQSKLVYMGFTVTFIPRYFIHSAALAICEVVSGWLSIILWTAFGALRGGLIARLPCGLLQP